MHSTYQRKKITSQEPIIPVNSSSGNFGSTAACEPLCLQTSQLAGLLQLWLSAHALPSFLISY